MMVGERGKMGKSAKTRGEGIERKVEIRRRKYDRERMTEEDKKQKR